MQCCLIVSIGIFFSIQTHFYKDRMLLLVQHSKPVQVVRENFMHWKSSIVLPLIVRIEKKAHIYSTHIFSHNGRVALL